MDTRAIPTGAACLVDANIFLYHLGGRSEDCTSVLRSVARGEINAFVTTIVIAEVLHRRMVGEAIEKGLVSQSQALKKLKAEPALVSSLSAYIEDVKKLLLLPLRIIEVLAADISASHPVRREHGLLVNDSINLACMQRLGLVDIVTHDRDFKRVPGLRVWAPTDI